MKTKQYFYYMVMLSFLVFNCNLVLANYDGTKFSADEILQKVSEKLNKFKLLNYDYTYEAKYFSTDFNYNAKANINLDFTRNNNLIGFNYQIESESAKFIYNGTEMFELNKKLKTINDLNTKPRQGNFNSIVYFSNSLLTLKNVIPLIIADKELAKTISDTVINSKSYYVISFTPIKKIIDPLGKSFSSMTIERNLTYKIIIDKKENLPFAVVQTFSDNTDFQKTFFTNIKESRKLTELSWYYSTYLSNYTLNIEKERPNLIQPGTIAPDWSLSVIGQTQPLNLNQLKGKYVLLEFWVIECGYCIAAVPKLNELQKKFGNKNLEILGINLYDKKEAIALFSKKNSPKYPILYNGEKVADKYGIGSYPKIVLIDKDGKVIYSGSLLTTELALTTELEQFLDKTLK